MERVALHLIVELTSSSFPFTTPRVKIETPAETIVLFGHQFFRFCDRNIVLLPHIPNNSDLDMLSIDMNVYDNRGIDPNVTNERKVTMPKTIGFMSSSNGLRPSSSV